MAAPTIAEIVAFSMRMYYARVAIREGRKAAAHYQGARNIEWLKFLFY